MTEAYTKILIVVKPTLRIEMCKLRRKRTLIYIGDFLGIEEIVSSIRPQINGS